MDSSDGRGLAAYDPRMMVRVLIYGYCREVASSRRIERATYEDVAFRYLVADQHPDHDTIAAFRQEQLAPLGVAAILYASQRSVAHEVPCNWVDDVAPPSWRHLPAGCRCHGRSVIQAFCGNCEPAAAKGHRALDDFWATVLLATLFCYAVYPFFPLTPPRMLFGDVPVPHVDPLLRRLNFWLLDHYSVNACIFPSGHVAAVTAVALAVRKHAPRLGAMFMILAASVALAIVYGRYHYASDAIAGALVGVAAYNVSKLCK